MYELYIRVNQTNEFACALRDPDIVRFRKSKITLVSNQFHIGESIRDQLGTAIRRSVVDNNYFTGSARAIES
jgi:hypothetical protein